MYSEISDYVINLRRELHMYPEVDFDLPKTTAIVKRELDAIGVTYTEKYGKGSVVGYINPEKAGFTIALRADMDALRILEKADTPYRSRHEGMMHACGHDAHTATLLGAAKVLKGMESELDCRVKLIFQPSEEGVKSGAGMMIAAGVLDDVDIIIGEHVSNAIEDGTLGVCPKESQSTSRHFKIEIEGKSAHVAQAQTGIDAIAVAFRIYSDIQLMLTREVSPLERCLCSIGTINAGTTHNVVADHAVLTGTIRTFNVELSKFMIERIEKICKSVSDLTGANISVHGPAKSTCVYNNPYLSELVMSSMKKVVGEENVVEFPISITSEDFSLYSDVVPAVLFRLGTGDEKRGITAPLHHSNFDLSESAIINGVRTMVQFVVDYQGGIDKDKMLKSDTRRNTARVIKM